MTHIHEVTGLQTGFTWTGAVGTNDNDVVYTSRDISDYNLHVIECTTGTVDIDISTDGTNFTSAVAVRNVKSANSTTFVMDAIAASVPVVELRGRFKAIRVLQKGATASNARGWHAMSR